MTPTKIIRTIHPEVRIIDEAKGICDYVASDQTVDSYKEVIRADGWRFSMFAKNAPFVDSHNYSTIGNLLGKVISFEVVNGKLVERVQWAIDVPDCRLAQIGWKMTAASYLKAVSVGFWPTEYVTPGQTGWKEELAELKLDENAGIRCIYTEQEQVELSACIIGANPNALAKAYKADAISEEDIDFLSRSATLNPQRANAPSAFDSGLADWASDQTRQQFIRSINDAMRVK
jgi:hypothetical protein